ncbi:GPO family capsid scaffolding protein [Salmonella enterica]|nr:GPO family capsid scaffolding protein [Salmonella enterica]UYA02617.1 GPO family capsid scaffolding protein [Salmonella enterica subsp. enterica serovar London]
MADEKESEQPKVTGWVTICRSGRSLDGRIIKPQILRDAADMYKLQGVPAMMWPYHVSSPVYRWNATNFGKVLELKAEDREDATYLLAKLQPNKFAIAANRDRQKIFTSAEFEPNCLGTGKWYLSGLALTDVPASPWTTELMFSQQAHSSIYGQPEVFSLGAENNTEDSAMTQDQYDTLLNAIYNKGQQIDGIETRLNQYSQMINQMNAQQFAAQPQPAYAQPQQFAAQPQPAYAQPQQFAAQPQPAYAQPQQFAAQPQPAYAQPQQFAAQPQPAYAQPQQFAAQPQPAYAQPQQFAAQPQPAYAQPQQFAAQPQPAYAQPQQFAAQPQPAYAQPQQFAAQPQPTDALNNAQFQHLLTAISGINSGVAGMEQKFAQLMQDTTQTPSLNPAGGNQINIV